MQRFRGVAHVHSRYSFDGRLTLPELAAFFQERGVDFVLMSEHVESLDPEKVRSFIADCRACSSDKLLLVPGIEIDALNALFYNVPSVESWSDNEALARRLAAAGAFVAVSHPVKVKHLPAVTESLVEGVEVWNSRHDGKGAVNPRMVHFWSSLRNRLGRHNVPLCGIDFHGRHDFVPLVFELECERLDAACIMAAIRAGSYRIVVHGKPLPLNFASGRLALRYRWYANSYRLAYAGVYGIHRVTLKLGLHAPKSLKSRLGRLF